MDDLERIYEIKKKAKPPKAFTDKVATLDKSKLGDVLVVLAELFDSDDEVFIRSSYSAWYDALREEDRIKRRIEEGSAVTDPDADPSI
jgi:hypothetical protein